MPIASAKVRGGFPVEVVYSEVPPDPSVGIFTTAVEVMDVRTVRGTSAAFLNLSADEFEALADEIAEGIS